MTAALRILLIDDDPNDRQLVRQTLERAFSSMELREVTGEVELGRVLEQDPPDVVLTDYALGWTSGLAVLLKARQRWPGVPVLMVTGTGSEEIAVECMKEGLEDYILKSSRHIVRLPSAVEAALERVQERRALREAETRYQSLFAGVSVGLYRATAAGEVLEANPALVRSLGYPNRDALIGTCLIDLCVEPEARADWESLATGERHAIDAELRMRGRDGSTLWVAHRTRAVREAGGPILCVEGSLEDITVRKEAEAELRRQHEELHLLAGRLAEVEETERQRLARELHDQVGQNLTALGISLSVVRAQLPRGTEPAIDARIEDLLALVEETTSRIRSVMGDLRPPVLDDYGLLAALGWYARQVSLRTGVPVEVAGDECAPRLPAPVESALFRIAQEALNNIAKHANATLVTIVFECRGAMARLVIADDGRGFASSEAGATEERPRWGLRIMRERADGAGGTCRVESHPGQGTRVIVEIPR